MVKKKKKYSFIYEGRYKLKIFEIPSLSEKTRAPCDTSLEIIKFFLMKFFFILCHFNIMDCSSYIYIHIHVIFQNLCKDESEIQEMEGEEERIEEEEEEPSCEPEEIILKVEAIPETSSTEERKRIKRAKITPKIEPPQERVRNDK